MATQKSLIKSSKRVRDLGEVFTPDFLVERILDQFPLDAWLPEKNWLEPTCGNGQFVIAVLRRKLATNLLVMKPFPALLTALNTTFGLDIMRDNIVDCHRRIMDEIVVPHWKKHIVSTSTQEIQQLQFMCVVHNNIRHTKDSLKEDFAKFQFFTDLPQEIREQQIKMMQAIIDKDKRNTTQ